MSAQALGATHVIVVCDTFEHGDYPVSVMPGENAREKAAEYDGKDLQRVMEVYSLKLDIEAQLQEFRAFHFDDTPSQPFVGIKCECGFVAQPKTEDEWSLMAGIHRVTCKAKMTHRIDLSAFGLDGLKKERV